MNLITQYGLRGLVALLGLGFGLILYCRISSPCICVIYLIVGCTHFQILTLYLSACAPVSLLNSLAFLSSSSAHTL